MEIEPPKNLFKIVELGQVHLYIFTTMSISTLISGFWPHQAILYAIIRKSPKFEAMFLVLLGWHTVALGQSDTSSAHTLFEEGKVYYDQHQFDSAELKFQAAADLYERLEDWPHHFDAEVALNKTYFRNLKVEVAQTHITKLLAFAQLKIDSNSLIISQILDCRGNIRIWQGKFVESLEDLKRSLAIKQSIKADIHELARTYDFIGDAYRNLDQMKPAMKHYEEMLSLYESSDAHRAHLNVAKGLSDLAILSRKRGEFDLALSQYQRALHIVEAQANEEPQVLSAALNGIGVIYATTGRYPQALDYFNKLLDNDLKNLPPDHPDIAKVYTNLGILHELMGDFKQSVTLHERALNIKSKSLGEDNPSLIYDYKGLAQVHINIGDIEQTLLYAHKTEQLELEHMGPKSRNLAMSYLIIGSAYNLKGDYENARKYLLQSEAIIAEKDPLDPQIGPIYHNMSSVFTNLLMYDSAIFYGEKALAINEDNFGKIHPHVAGNRRTLGHNYQLLGDLEQGRTYFEEALAISLEVDGSKHQNTVMDYIKLAENARLAKHYREGLVFSQSSLIAAATDFRDTMVSANPTTAQTRLPKDMAVALAVKGKILRDLYIKTKDISYLISANETFVCASEMISEAQFSYKTKGSVALLKQDLASIYESAIEVCYLLFKHTSDEQYVDRALQFAEQSKATLLLAALNESRARKFAGIPSHLLENENNLRRDLTYFEQRLNQPTLSSEEYGMISEKIFELKSSYDSLVFILENNYPKYYSLKFNAAVVSQYELKKEFLEPADMLIEYFVGEEDIYTIVISQNHDDLLRRSFSNTLADTISDLIKVVKDRTIGSDLFSNLSTQLFRALIEPIGVAKLEKKLIIVPDGILNYVPFEVLTPMATKSDNYFSLPYLFIDHSISYTYSATFLNDIKNTEVKSFNDDFLAFAPTFKNRAEGGHFENLKIETTQSTYRGELAELKGASQEVSALADYFEGSFFQADEATESVFKQNAERFGMLHLATHAILDDVNPMNSKLLFTAGIDTLEDADLHAWELYNMDLKARLAVLSACNTGFGKIQKGEGVLSLGRAFAYAGCPSIVMSLWPAQDRSTTKIMSTFYQFIAKGYEKDEALREAKLAYIRHAEDYNTHPFFWAGFILQGSHDPLSSPVNWGLFLIILVTLLLIAIAYYHNFSGR